MNKQNILRTVINYCLCNNRELEGALNGEQGFKIIGKTISERCNEDGFTTYGYAIDVLSDLIEKGKFFGWYVSEDPLQADNNSNAKIRLLNPFKKSKLVEIVGKIHRIKEGGIIEIKVPIVKQKRYMNSIRMKGDFYKTANLIADFDDFKNYKYLKDINEKKYPNIVDRLFQNVF